MQDTDRPMPEDGLAVGRNDFPIPDAGPPSESPDAPIPGPAGPLRDPGLEPGDRETDLRDELARRSGAGMPSPAGRDRPDLGPDIETPDRPM